MINTMLSKTDSHWYVIVMVVMCVGALHVEILKCNLLKHLVHILTSLGTRLDECVNIVLVHNLVYIAHEHFYCMLGHKIH